MSRWFYEKKPLSEMSGSELRVRLERAKEDVERYRAELKVRAYPPGERVGLRERVSRMLGL